MSRITENHVEKASLAWLAELGYDISNGLNVGLLVPKLLAWERG